MRNRLDISTLEPTRYEVAILQNGRMVASLGFAARRAKQVLMGFAAANGERVLALLTDAEADSDYRYSAAQGLQFGSVSVAYTGRTERECAIQAEAESLCVPGFMTPTWRRAYGKES